MPITFLMGTVPIDSQTIGVSRETYHQGNFLLLFNFNPEGEQNFNYDYGRNTGNVNITVDFSQNTANATSLVVTGYFEQEGWLDGNKNWALRNSY